MAIEDSNNPPVESTTANEKPMTKPLRHRSPSSFFAGCVALLVLILEGCAASPTDPTPPGQALPQPFLFACGRWSPHDPQAGRTVIDFGLTEMSAEGGPTPDGIAAIVGAGGRVLHIFHVPIVRANFDVARVPEVVTRGYRPASYARTVTDPSGVDVSVIVVLGRPPTEADLAAAQALGGRITSIFDHVLGGYAVTLPDSAIASLRALDGVRSVRADGVGCIT